MDVSKKSIFKEERLNLTVFTWMERERDRERYREILNKVRDRDKDKGRNKMFKLIFH